MGADTKIEWADATVNFWTGCTALTPACHNCYARDLSEGRMGWAKWGAGEARHRFKRPLQLLGELDRKAAREGRRLRVFINSLSDTFDAEVPDEWRDEIFGAAVMLHNLDFLLLTKRHHVMRTYVTRLVDLAQDSIENLHHEIVDRHPIVAGMIGHPDGCKVWPLPNVWLGVTAEDQERANLRIPDLLATPTVRRFVSMEPLLGPVDLTAIERRGGAAASGYMRPLDGRFRTLDWVIVGGESGGPNARPMHPEWARSLRDQCAAAGVPFFFKQWGEWGPDEGNNNALMSYAHPTDATQYGDTLKGSTYVYRLGKKAAGRLLDGVEHNAMPAAHPDGSSAQRPAPQGVLVSSERGVG